MSEQQHQRSGKTASAAQQSHRKITTTISQLELLSRLHGSRKTLIAYAEQLVIDMKSSVPSEGLVTGCLHQLEGKKLLGALCTNIIVFAESHAVFIDTSTGVVVTVDALGRRRTTVMVGFR